MQAKRPAKKLRKTAKKSINDEKFAVLSIIRRTCNNFECHKKRLVQVGVIKVEAAAELIAASQKRPKFRSWVAEVKERIEKSHHKRKKSYRFFVDGKFIQNSQWKQEFHDIIPKQEALKKRPRTCNYFLMVAPCDEFCERRRRTEREDSKRIHP